MRIFFRFPEILTPDADDARQGVGVRLMPDQNAAHPLNPNP